MASIDHIGRNIAFDLLSEIGTKVVAAHNVYGNGLISKGMTYYTVKSAIFPYLRFEETGDGWPAENFFKKDES